MSAYLDYWLEAVGQSLDSLEIELPEVQRMAIAQDMLSAHEMFSESMGHNCIPNPLASENSNLKRKLEAERKKEVCKECWGRGRLVTTFGSSGRSSDSQCWKCNGEGYK